MQISPLAAVDTDKTVSELSNVDDTILPLVGSHNSSKTDSNISLGSRTNTSAMLFLASINY